MAKKIDNYYSERSAYFILAAPTIPNATWFNAALQPSYAADCYGASAYYTANDKIVGLKFPKNKPHPEFVYKNKLGYCVPKRGSEAESLLAAIDTDFEIFGKGPVNQFDVKVVNHYDAIMANVSLSDEQRARMLKENTITRTMEVFRCERGQANRTYALYRSPLAVGFYLPDVPKAMADLLVRYKNLSNPVAYISVETNDEQHRVGEHHFHQLMGVKAPYHLNGEYVLEFPEHKYVDTLTFFKFLIDHITANGVLPEPAEGSDLPELTLWRPEVV